VWLQLLDTTAKVATPERVEFRYRIAGPAQRGVAWLIDLLVRAAVFSAVATVVVLMGALPGLDGLTTGLFFLFFFLLDWFYGVVFEAFFHGQTPGKRALQLRVVRLDGSPARLPDVLLRNLLRAVDTLPFAFGVAVLVMTIDTKLRRLGDLVGGTVVVSEEKTRMLQEVRIEPPVSDAERQQLPAGVDLSPEELATLEAFLRRRDRLSPERVEELAWLFGPALSERTGIEAPTWERVLVLAYARATGKDAPAEVPLVEVERGFGLGDGREAS
jgi:uncharacterized RDD family membrane protein YckC